MMLRVRPLYYHYSTSHPFVMHLIIHMFNTSMIPYISLDQYLNTIPNLQNMRFFCCSVYDSKVQEKKNMTIV